MIRSLVVGVCALLCACAAEAPAPAFDPAAVRTAVTALVQRWSDAGEAGDWDSVAETYADAEGFVWIEQGEVRYPDHAAIVAGLDQVRESNARIVNDVSDIVVTPLSADFAAYRTVYTLTVSTQQFSFTSSGVLAGVAIRQDGTWRLLQGAFSERPAQQPG